MDTKVIKFLRESNNIEDVWDDQSLNDAVKAWEYVIKEEKITPSVVRQTHRILMQNQPLEDTEKGSFRRCPVYIGGHEAKPWYAVPELVEIWCGSVMASIQAPGEDGYNIKIDHVQYEQIHPFVDGNGRTGRIFMNWERVKCDLPILVIKEKEKSRYYEWFS